MLELNWGGDILEIFWGSWGISGAGLCGLLGSVACWALWTAGACREKCGGKDLAGRGVIAATVAMARCVCLRRDCIWMWGMRCVRRARCWWWRRGRQEEQAGRTIESNGVTRESRCGHGELQKLRQLSCLWRQRGDFDFELKEGMTGWNDWLGRAAVEWE